jgi:hypothetical protein
MQSNYPNTVIYVSEHISASHFDNPESGTRATWYGVSGVPTVILDGSRQSVGGGDGCASRYNAYRNLYNQRMTETSSTSPVEVTGYFSVFGNSGSLQATFRLLDPVNLGTVRASFFVYEDEITWCCGGDGASHWDEIVRTVKDESVTTLINPGDQVTVVKEIPISSGWNTANLHAVAILQQISGNKQVIQSARLTNVVDFALGIPRRVGSVPEGNGVEIFPGTVQNVGSATDVLTLSVDQAMGWPTDFQIEGDSNWYTSHPVTLAPGATKGISIRIRTDGVKRIGTGSFSCTSGNSGRMQPASMRVFNGSHSILFVDNDNGQTWGSGGPTCDSPFTTALTNLGYLYENWDVLNVHAGATPSSANMNGFDNVIWETGYYTADPISADDCASLQQYLDSGGSLFMSSMDLLSTAAVPASFIHDYLGVASWTNNSKCHTASGVGGDPITDGMVLPLTWFSNDQPNRVDTTNPGNNAAGILISETSNPNVVRFSGTNFRVVFSTIIQNAISQSAPAPNNSQTFIERALVWLTQTDVSATPFSAAGDLTGVLWAQPNPFSPQTEIAFSVSASGGDVRLTLVDASGRIVRTLVNGGAQPGRHTVRWDGTDDAGRAVASGIYFARLRCDSGTSAQKLVLMR